MPQKKKKKNSLMFHLIWISNTISLWFSLSLLFLENFFENSQKPLTPPGSQCSRSSEEPSTPHSSYDLLAVLFPAPLVLVSLHHFLHWTSVRAAPRRRRFIRLNHLQSWFTLIRPLWLKNAGFLVSPDSRAIQRLRRGVRVNPRHKSSRWP